MENKQNDDKQELAELEAYFDSDEFLTEPWMQALAKELDRQWVLLPDPVRLREIDRAWQLLEEIIRKERLDAELSTKRTELPATGVVITMIADHLDIGARTIFPFSLIVDLCDSMVFYPRTDDRMVMDLYFENAFREIC